MITILNNLGLDKLKILHGTDDTNIQFCCPWHGERRPSCGISVDKQAGKCFACGETFNLPKLIAQCKGYSFPEAYDFLAEFTYTDDRSIELGEIRRYDEEGEAAGDFVQPLYKIAPYKSGKVIHPYLEHRGFNEEDVQQFMLGWDSFEKRITIPVFWKNGELCGVIGRSVLKNAQPKYKIYDFPQSKIIFPYNLFTVLDKSAIIVEGTLDAMWLHKFGYKNAVSIINATVSEEQLRLLQKEGVERLILALDSDKAGERGCARLYEKAKREFQMFRFPYPEGKKDVQEMTKEELQWGFSHLLRYPYMKLKRIE